MKKSKHDQRTGDGDPASPQTTPAQVTNDVDPNQLAQFVTTIKNADQQVGEHIIQALQHDDSVAVITTVAMVSSELFLLP